jgi:UDP-N-acetylglucosamine 2-epimerase (non-hydrolysing)
MIACVIGTRPEAVKMAPVIAALRRRSASYRVIASGQHHEWRMMGAFLAGFDVAIDHQLPSPSHDLLGSFLSITTGLGVLFGEHKPRLVLAVGDTTTVLAAAFAARKTGCGFGHVEAGLRAFSRELPEEEHRICSDAMADLLFAPTLIAVANLTRERVNGRVVHTGNTVLDALRARPLPIAQQRNGVLVTLHRQETVDDPTRLAAVLAAVERLGSEHRVTWPVHPRTRAKVAEARCRFPQNIEAIEPLDHAGFLTRLASARLVVTDSGGVQEEAAILGTPGVIVRDHTERIETIEAGLGLLASTQTASIVGAANEIFAAWSRFARPMPELYGDGHASDKIVQACLEWIRGSAGRGAIELVA